LEFVADETGTTATSLTINAEAIGNSLPMPNVDYGLSSKPLTNATTSWNNVPSWTMDNTYQSPNISAVVQEMVDRNDWSNGNAMTFIIKGTGTRTAKSYETGNPPRLVVDYSAADMALCDMAVVNIIE